MKIDNVNLNYNFLRKLYKKETKQYIQRNRLQVLIFIFKAYDIKIYFRIILQNKETNQNEKKIFACLKKTFRRGENIINIVHKLETAIYHIIRYI